MKIMAAPFWADFLFFVKIAAFIAAFSIARALPSGPFGADVYLAGKANSSGPAKKARRAIECR